MLVFALRPEFTIRRIFTSVLSKISAGLAAARPTASGKRASLSGFVRADPLRRSISVLFMARSISSVASLKALITRTSAASGWRTRTNAWAVARPYWLTAEHSYLYTQFLTYDGENKHTSHLKCDFAF